MIFGLTPESLVFIAVFLGTLARTIIPYLGKLKSIPDMAFEWKYAISFGIALVESFVISVLSITAIPTDLLTAGLSSLFVFGGAFAWAYTTNDLFNRIISAQAATVVMETQPAKVEVVKPE